MKDKKSVIQSRPNLSKRRFYAIFGYKPEQYNEKSFNAAFKVIAKKEKLGFWTILLSLLLVMFISMTIVSAWFIVVNDFQNIYFALVAIVILSLFSSIAIYNHRNAIMGKIKKKMLNISQNK